ncbi:MAG: hypothetical protein AABY33_03340 [Pseudomonadota bacterium]
MANVTEKEIHDAEINTSFLSGNGLAIRLVILDAVQRYHTAEERGDLSPQEKKDLIIQLTKDAARGAKDGIFIGTWPIKFDLTLTPAQKELTARAYEKFFGSKNAEQIADFIDDEKLIGIIKKMPPIKGKNADELMNEASKISKDQQKSESPLNMSELYKSKDIFEEVAKKHGILYAKKDGVEQKLGDYMEAAIKEVKTEITAKLKNSPAIDWQSFNHAQPLTPLPTRSNIAPSTGRNYTV